MKLLLVSFNPHVRYASCMAVGIAMAGTGDARAIAILEPMIDDLADFVRQGALIATSMVMMQCPESHRSYKKFVGKLTGIVGEKVRLRPRRPPAKNGSSITCLTRSDTAGKNPSLLLAVGSCSTRAPSQRWVLSSGRASSMPAGGTSA